ncbi:MAG: MATE family efflux transporter [Nanoarchaeota archaeon]|nr:MATE family efflux transporter [Nanoarchaeota archaeon]MBU4300844.1 MATE family efflux transporter [Nanoarchaeota archaeon]MBU4452186.1 MATE family efflux transporter [Nanoarchaeota archaeon]MCG2724476.1 MATE family efflux transporter [archaeon]
MDSEKSRGAQIHPKGAGNHLTEGPIISSMLALALPIIFANILQTMYQLIDTFWVGRLGANAIAAVSLSFPILFLIISIGGGLAIAGTILVAHHKGGGRQHSINYVSAQTFLMMVLVSIPLSIIGYFASPYLIKLMGADAAVFTGAVSYLQISFAGLVFVFGYFVFQSLMRGVGDVKTPIYVVLGTVALNYVLDPLFIMGYGPIPAYGVAGAAIATVITQGLAAIIGLWMLFSGKYGIHLNLKNLAPDYSVIKRIFALGVPASLEQSSQALGMAVMTFLVASFGTEVVAMYGIGGRIISFVIIPAIGFSIATSTLVSQNIGAGKKDRAREITKKGAIMAFLILTFAGIIIFIFAKPLAALFIPGDIAVIEGSALFVRITALTFGFIGVQQVLAGAFRGWGDTFIPMILAIFALWVLRFPLAYVLSKHTALAASGIWWAFPVANVVAGVAAVLWYRSGSWRESKLNENFRMREEVIEEAIADEGVQ